MKVKFYGGSKDGVEREVRDQEAGMNLTVVSMLYHPYCPQVDNEIYDMGRDGNLHVRPTEIKPCQKCAVTKDDMIKSEEKRRREIAMHRAICKCDYCGIREHYDY